MSEQIARPAAAAEPMEPGEFRAVSVISLVAMLRIVGLFAVTPVLAKYAASLEGATPFLIGIAVGGYGLTQAALQIPLGLLSDRVGRIPVIVGGLAVFVLGSILAAVADSIWVVIAGRFLQGAGAISSTLTALMSDATRESVRTRSMAVLGIGIGVAFIFAQIAGPSIAAIFDVAALFWIAALLGCAGAMMLRALPGGIAPPAQKASWSIRPALRAPLLRLDAYIFLLHSILIATFVALPFLLTDRLDMPDTSHWKVIVWPVLISLLITVPLVMADDRKGKRSTVSIAVALMLIAEAMLMFGSAGFWVVFAAMVLFFAGFNFLEAGLPARLSLLADHDARGASFGVYSSSQFLGAFAGGLLGGGFLAAGGPTGVFTACLLIAAIWLVAAGLIRS